MNILINRDVFKAAQHTMPKSDPRQHLNSVCLRMDGQDCMNSQAYSTDGRVLFACRFDIDYRGERPPTGIFDIIIPADTVKHAAKGKSLSANLVSMDDGTYMLDGLQFTAMSGPYPDVARVIPTERWPYVNKLEKAIFGVDTALLFSCAKALGAWFRTKKGKIVLYQYGPSNPSIMQGRDNSAICVIAPIRVNDGGPYSFSAISRP